MTKLAKYRTICKPPRITKKSAPWEKAYIAGLVDAKGSLAIYPSKPRRSVRQQLMTAVSLNGHDINELRMVQERYGGVIRIAGRSKQKHTTLYRLLIHRKSDIVFLITDISRYLMAKSKQADLLLKYCRSRLETLQSVEHHSLAPITEEERSIARELIRLNRKCRNQKHWIAIR